MTNAQHLLVVLQSHAPNASAQQLCTTIHNRTPSRERERTLAFALIDGLRYGNWPWVLAELGKDYPK